MHRALIALALFAAAASAWQVNLWPVEGSSSSTPQASTITPAFAGDCVIVMPVATGPVFAVNTTSKTLLWGKTFGAVNAISVVPAASVVVVYASDLTYAYDIASGKQLWLSDTVVATGPTIVSGCTIALLNSGSGGSNSAIPSGLVAIDSQTGKVVYTIPQANSYQTLMSLGADTAAYIDADGNFVVFTVSTGKVAWRTMAGLDYPLSLVACGEGNVALANTTATPYQSVVLILDAQSGTLMHTFEGMVGAGSSTGAAFQNGYFYAVIEEGLVQAYDLTTGYMHWQYSLANTYGEAATPYFTPKYLVSAAFNNFNQQVFYFLDLKNGSIVASLSGFPSTPSATFAVSGNFLLIPNLQGLVIVDLSTDKVVYRNEDLPYIGQVGAAGIVSHGNELVIASETTLYGFSLASRK